MHPWDVVLRKRFCCKCIIIQHCDRVLHIVCLNYQTDIREQFVIKLKLKLFISKVLLKCWMLIQLKFVSTYLCRIYDDLWISNENNIWTILLFFRDSTAFNAGLVDNDQTVYDVSMNRTLYMGVVSVSNVVANTAGRVIAIHNRVTTSYVMWWDKFYLEPGCETMVRCSVLCPPTCLQPREKLSTVICSLALEAFTICRSSPRTERAIRSSELKRMNGWYANCLYGTSIMEVNSKSELQTGQYI